MVASWERAEDNLRRQGFVIFNPMCVVRRVGAGRRLVEVERPYIAGYMFVMFDVAVDRWQRVNTTRGVQRLLGSEEKPYPVRQDAMELLWNEVHRRRIEEADRAVARRLPPPVGSTVRMISGALTGFVGVVTWSRGDRVKALFGLLGGGVSHEFRSDCVEVVG